MSNGVSASVSRWVPGLAGLLATVAGRGESPVTEQFQNVQQDRVQWVCLHGLPDNGQEELELSESWATSTSKARSQVCGSITPGRGMRETVLKLSLQSVGTWESPNSDILLMSPPWNVFLAVLKVNTLNLAFHTQLDYLF